MRENAAGKVVYNEHANRYHARQRFIAISGQIANAVAQESAIKLHLRELYDRAPHGLKWVAQARAYSRQIVARLNLRATYENGAPR